MTFVKNQTEKHGDEKKFESSEEEDRKTLQKASEENSNTRTQEEHTR